MENSRNGRDQVWLNEAMELDWEKCKDSTIRPGLGLVLKSSITHHISGFTINNNSDRHVTIDLQTGEVLGYKIQSGCNVVIEPLSMKITYPCGTKRLINL